MTSRGSLDALAMDDEEEELLAFLTGGGCSGSAHQSAPYAKLVCSLYAAMVHADMLVVMIEFLLGTALALVADGLLECAGALRSISVGTAVAKSRSTTAKPLCIAQQRTESLRSGRVEGFQRTRHTPPPSGCTNVGVRICLVSQILRFSSYDPVARKCSRVGWDWIEQTPIVCVESMKIAVRGVFATRTSQPLNFVSSAPE